MFEQHIAPIDLGGGSGPRQVRYKCPNTSIRDDGSPVCGAEWLFHPGTREAGPTTHCPRCGAEGVYRITFRGHFDSTTDPGALGRAQLEAQRLQHEPPTETVSLAVPELIRRAKLSITQPLTLPREAYEPGPPVLPEHAHAAYPHPSLLADTVSTALVPADAVDAADTSWPPPWLSW